VLSKLTGGEPLVNWIEVIQPLQLDPSKIIAKPARELISATNASQRERIKVIAQRMFEASVT
jgi:hypothetical protein